MSDQYKRVSSLAESGELDAAWKIVSRMLIDDPMDPRALIAASFIMRRWGHLPQAYHFGRAATQVWASEFSGWLNFGHAASELWLTKEAEHAYRRAIKLCKNERDQKDIWLNLSALYLDNGMYDKAEALTREILAVDPEHRSANANLGFCLLAKRDWSGWKGYHNTIGTDWRPKVQYRDEPEWAGEPDKNVVLYADQGLGDEISFASMVPDAAKVCKKLILDCDKRLEGLFRRSFPNVKVYGTRTDKEAKWDKQDWQIDASLPLGQIGEFFRTKDSDFPGTPYLTPDLDRVKMWKGMFHDKGKPIIGIAWTGGIPKTNARNRRLGLEDFLPVFNSVDAHFVSLQYKDAQGEIDDFLVRHPGIDLKQYAFGTLTKDYDDTAALIACMDHVLCMQTAVAHTAGALGVPVTVLLPVATQWRYGNSEDSIPWYKSLKVIRQANTGSWSSEIERAVRQLEADFPRVSSRAGETARDGGLRDSFFDVRPNRVIDREQDAGYAHVGLRVRGEHDLSQGLEGRS